MPPPRCAPGKLGQGDGLIVEHFPRGKRILRSQLLLDAPGMKQCAIPTTASAYAAMEDIKVECSGKSTTTDGGWSLGFIDCKRHAAASAWVTEYLNKPDPKAPEGSSRLNSGKLARV